MTDLLQGRSLRKGAKMPRVDTPWVGLAALVAMFVIPFLPSWLFDGPATIRHRPRRHICADCGEPWTARHVCEPQRLDDRPSVRARIERITPSTSKALVTRRSSIHKIGNS